jgi:hypothetical protein
MQCVGKELSSELSSEEKKEALQQAMAGKKILCPRPPGAVKRPQRSSAFFIENLLCTALSYERARRLAALFGGFRPGQ